MPVAGIAETGRPMYRNCHNHTTDHISSVTVVSCEKNVGLALTLTVALQQVGTTMLPVMFAFYELYLCFELHKLY